MNSSICKHCGEIIENDINSHCFDCGELINKDEYNDIRLHNIFFDIF